MIRPAITMRRRHRHDKPGGTEPTLGTVMVHHRLLHRVQFTLWPRQPLNRAHGFPIQLGHEQNTGIERPRAIDTRDHDRAGATITLIAAFLGAAEPLHFAQPIKQRRCRRHVHLHSFSIQGKSHFHDENLPPYQKSLRAKEVSMRRRHPARVGNRSNLSLADLARRRLELKSQSSN